MSIACQKDYSIRVFAGSVLLASVTNPSCRADYTTFTATVSGLGAAPTGNVQFKEGVTVLSTQPVVAGVATWIDSDLAVGLHDLTATFVGTGPLSGVTVVSNTVSQLVNCCYTDFNSTPSSMVTVSAWPCINWWISWLGVNPFTPHPLWGAGFDQMSVVFHDATQISWQTPAPTGTYSIALNVYDDGSADMFSANGCTAAHGSVALHACPWDGVHVHMETTGGSAVCSGIPRPAYGFDN